MSVKNENNAAAFVYKSVRISMLQGKYAGKKPLEIGELVFGFTYYEDISNKERLLLYFEVKRLSLYKRVLRIFFNLSNLIILVPSLGATSGFS